MSHDQPFTLWRGGLPAWLERENIEIAPGDERSCADPLWAGGLVVVEHGRVVLVGAAANEVELAEGAVFTVHRLRGATLHNREPSTAVLCVARRALRRRDAKPLVAAGRPR